MTKEERQALREKHAPQDGDPTNPCEFCWPTAYPCDVIKVLDALEEANFQAAINYERGYDDGFKVLDATENLKFNDLKVEVDCTHIIGLMTLPEGWDVIEHGQTDFAFNYCPKCGVEL